MSTEFWVQIVVYAVSFGIFTGSILTKLKYLEKKMDKHNGIVERVYILEGSIKSVKKDMVEVKHEINGI